MDRKQLRFSKEFAYISNIIIIDGEVIKNHYDLVDINQEIINKNRVIVQTGDKMTCYFRKEYKKELIGIITRLPNPMFVYDKITIVS